MTASQPRHPFTVAWETWQAWSDAEVMRTARGRTAARGESLAVFDQHPEWTQGPGPLQGLAANREVVDHLVGWRWGAMREAREQGGRPSGDHRAVHPPRTAAPGGLPPAGQRRSVTAMGKVQITIEVDDGRLGSYEDAQLVMCWHLAQANPAPHGDRAAGELVERIGREIIRRWLQATLPLLWRHQGRDHYWQQLRQLATFTPGAGEVDSPAWHDGVWVPRAAGDQGVADRP